MPRLLPVLLALAALLAGCAAPEAPAPAVVVDPTPVGADAVAVVHGLAADATNASPAAAAGIVPALLSVGHEAGEPTLGITKEGTLYYAAITFKNDIPVFPVTDILRSDDGGATWKDVTPRVGPARIHPDTGDPYVHVDVATGRVFDIDQRLLVTCHTVTYSDDKGETWMGDAATCVGPGFADHQTIVAAKKRATPDISYPSVVVVCWNSVPGTSCSRSLDGGHAFTPTQPPFVKHDGGPGCGLVGHLKAAPDGTIYLPQECAGVVRVVKSEDDGFSWTVSAAGKYTVPASGDPEYDPAIAVDADGNVHIVWEDSDGQLYLASSADKGKTWSERLAILPPTLTVGHLPALAAGGAGRVVVAYMGSDTPKGYETSKEDQKFENWHGYLAVIEDALGPSPVATTVRVNPYEDPLVHGACGPSFRCPGAVDFIDVVVDADGRPWAAFVDACSATCAAEAGAKNDQALGLVATFAQGPSLLAAGTLLPPIHPAAG